MLDIKLGSSCDANPVAPFPSMQSRDAEACCKPLEFYVYKIICFQLVQVVSRITDGCIILQINTEINILKIWQYFQRSH